jgi:siderophore synthetase component
MLDVQNKNTTIDHTLFDQEELNTIAFIKSEKPDLLNSYLSNIEAGRRGIFQRLLQAFVREKLIEEDRVVRLDGTESNICINLPSGKTVKFAVNKHHSLERFDVLGDPIVIHQEQTNILTHPVAFIELLKQEGMLEVAKVEQYERFKLEIQNGVANLTLALTGATIRNIELMKEAKKNNCQTSLEWVLKQKKENKYFSPLAFYEQCVVEGHPLHPGAKTKFGLQVADVIQYSPEWGATPEVALVAVQKESCHISSIDHQSVTRRLYDEYEGLQLAVFNTLHKKGLNPERYELIPVHPWQFENTLNVLYKEEMKQEKIIPIEDYRISTQSLVSFRSLAPIQKLGEGKHHIKTAVNVQTTSAIRTVSPNSVVNGPILSNILDAIQEKESVFDGKFVVLKEQAGVFFQPDRIGLSDDELGTLQANLASILRENPENYVRHEDEIPMAAASLIAESPISGKPIVIELIEEYARKHNVTDRAEAINLFIEKYAQVALPGFLTLMVRYGISLEGHMQNSVSVFRNGELVRMLIRDFGGIRILPARLWRQGFEADFYPKSSIVTNQESQLRSIISYSVMQNHFAELITCIVRALDIEEEQLWKVVMKVSRNIFKELKKDPVIKDQAAADEEAFFQPMINLKALATMRLRGDIAAYSFMKVQNPMSDNWKGANKL